MRMICLCLIAMAASLFAQPAAVRDDNVSKAQLEQQRQNLIVQYKNDLAMIEDELEGENIWLKSYGSYLTYQEVRESLDQLKKRITRLSRRTATAEEKEEIHGLLAKEKILTEQIELLKGHGESPFSDLMKPEEIGGIPSVGNPLEIFTGFSFMKLVNEQYAEYKLRHKELREIVSLLRKKTGIYKNLAAVDKAGEAAAKYDEAVVMLEKFDTALGTVEATSAVYAKRIEEIEMGINKEIKVQMLKLFNIGIIILVLFVIFFLLKLIVKKYITDNERFYMANKIITFANVTLVMIIILFNYIENVSYMVTVLGFASAGIAIAMKDWFMSMLGWLVIVIGGSIHVGDRVRVDKDGMKYVGDVLDISLLRITILEDITLTSYVENRRAGRIIFIPNNYIFTQMIANYTHVSLKTVWDGIDITITFDSNHKKAMHIAKEITRKYSKGYTDITRKQLNKLRNRYSLKNTNVEPRIFSFIEPNGLQISAWYLTNAYATLTLRSIISTEIVDAYNAEDDITIAYPTQRLHLSNADRREPPFHTGDSTEVL